MIFALLLLRGIPLVAPRPARYLPAPITPPCPLDESARRQPLSFLLSRKPFLLGNRKSILRACAVRILSTRGVCGERVRIAAPEVNLPWTAGVPRK